MSSNHKETTLTLALSQKGEGTGALVGVASLMTSEFSGAGLDKGRRMTDLILNHVA
jgi:hypothetical protein